MAKVTRTALAIDEDLLAAFDKWMARHGYTNRSEAVRDMVRQALVAAEWENPRSEVVATLSIIYDHHKQELAQQLTDMMHDFHHSILCSQHVHLDHDNCLEVIIMRGRAGDLTRVADAVTATKGVKAGRLTLMSQRI